ncbi:AAA family ATPase [Kribbella endophytica]
MLAQSTEDELILNGPMVRLGEPVDVIRSGSEDMTVGYTLRASRDEPVEMAVSITLKNSDGFLVVSEFSAEVDGEPAFYATSKRVPSAIREKLMSGDGFGESLLSVKSIDGRDAPSKTFVTFKGMSPDRIVHHRTYSQVFTDVTRNLRAGLLSEDPERSFEIYEQLSNWLRRSAEGIPKSLRRLLPEGRMTPTSFIEMSEDLEPLFAVFASHMAEKDEWASIPVGRFGHIYGRSAGPAVPPIGVSQLHTPAWYILASALEGQRSIRESIRYLGPLREEPQVVSPTGARYRNLPAGPKGEYTADLLAREKNRHIQYRMVGGRARRDPLPEAVSRWSSQLGVGDAVAVQDQGKLGRGLRIKVNGVERDLTTIGVGASQVLPVLAVVLSAASGSIVLLEQPELHLHPAVQSELADFFLFARPDLRIVVETHSEYLITRLRRRIAEGRKDAAAVTILFAEQDRGVSELRRIEISDLGDLSVWPKGFFDTQDEEGRALVRAARNTLGKHRGA